MAAFVTVLGLVHPIWAETVEHPVMLLDGVWFETRADTGTNLVTLQVGDDLLEVDRGEMATTRSDPTFFIETGSGSPGLLSSSAIHLAPASRMRNNEGTASTIAFESGFSLAGGGREVVFLDLGRAAGAADAVVWLPQEKVLVTGRLCSVGPVDLSIESDTAAWVEALERLRDLEPEWVIPWRGLPGGADLIENQIQRLSGLRTAVHDGLISGRTVDALAVETDAPWFAVWRDEDPAAADRALLAVFDELSGRRTPWELLEERRLREGESPTKGDDGWTPPTKVLWRNRWPDRIPMLAQVAPGVEIIPFDTAEEALASIEGADAIIGTATPELLAAGTELRWVQVGAAGVERYLKISRLADGEVLLTNGQRLASPVIGEHAMALTRALARGLNRAVAAQVDGEWRRFEIGDAAPLTQLRGKTLLVVGLGGIGTEVARLADAAGMRVTAIRSSRRSGPPFVAKVGLTEDLTEYVAQADVVVNCLPMTPDTEDIFDAAIFGAMRETAFFINIGRGGTVDTDALVAALENGVISGAGLDVTDPEPLPEGHPLWRAPNLVITPHFAAWSDAGRELQWLLFRENLRRFVAGERLLSVVDPARGY